MDSGVPWPPQGPHLLLIKGLSLLRGAPDGDRFLIGELSTSKKLSFLKEASYVYQENPLRRLHIGGQKVLAAGAAEEGKQGSSCYPIWKLGENKHIYLLTKNLEGAFRVCRSAGHQFSFKV